MATISGSLAASGQGSAFTPTAGVAFNFTVYGSWSGAFVLERSFDSGTTWVEVSRNVDGAAASYTRPVDFMVQEPVTGNQYRVNFIRTAGTLLYRFSQE